MKTFIQKISLVFILAATGLIVNAQKAQTIDVSALGQPIPNGGTFDGTLVGDIKPYLPVQITIKNTGDATLTLTKQSGKYIVLSNNGAGDFVVDESTLTGTIAAGASQTFSVNLSSSATNGSNKLVTMTILSNDPANATYAGTIKYTLTSVATALTKASDIGLSLYPNPSADGHFYITANNVAVDKVVVTNVSGVTQEFAGKEFSTSLKGLLLVQVYTDKGIVSEKVIIQE